MPQMRGTQGRRGIAWWLTFALAGLLSVLPLFLVEMPPLEDYPAHLARMYVLAFGAQDPFLSQMYAPSWHIIPNLAMDLIVPPLLPLLPLHLAGRLFLGLVLLLQFAGIVALHRAIYRRRSWWPLTSCLILYNGTFLLGFLNFLLGMGVALLVAAWWTTAWQRNVRLATAGLALGAVVAFFCHLLPFAFLGLIVGCTMAEDLLVRWWQGQRLLRPAMGHTAMLAAGFGIPTVLYFISPFAGTSSEPWYSSFLGKIYRLIVPVLNYDPVLDFTTAVATLAVVGLFLAYARRPYFGTISAADGESQVVMPPRILVAIIVLMLLWAVLPNHVKNLAWVDTRFPLLAATLLFAGLNPPKLPRRVAASVTVVLAGLFLTRTAVVAKVWYAHGDEVAEMRRTIAPVVAGSSVLVARVDPRTDPVWWGSLPASHRPNGMGSADDYISALVIPEHHAFWPFLFTDAAQQPLKVLAGHIAMSAPFHDPPDYRVLLQPHPEEVPEFSYLRDWQQHFDYVLMINPSGAPDLATLLPGRLEEVSRSHVAVLFRIRHG
jgi:hypothetical protein